MRKAVLLAAVGLAAVAVASGQTAVFDWRGTSANQAFGSGACCPGDLNGDGVPDFFVRDKPSMVGPRLVAVSGLDGAMLWTYVASAGDLVGPWAAGDVDGDGVRDVATGRQSSPGGATMLSGVDGSVLWSVVGTGAPLVTTLYPVDAGEDLDGDGVGDVLLRSEDVANDVLVLEARSGASGGLISTIMLGAYLNAPAAAALLPDVTGDGKADVGVGRAAANQAMIYAGPGLAVAQVLFGPPAIPSSPYPMFGASIGSPGDVNGDGIADLAVGRTPFVPGAFPFPTTILPAWTAMFSGVTFAPLYSLAGTNVVGAAHAPVRLGDLDGDGRDEFAVFGVASGPNFGGASVCSGASGTTLWSEFASGSDVPLVARGGDVTLDGAPEFFVLTPFEDVPYLDAGRVRVISWPAQPSAATSDLGGACGAYGGALGADRPVLGSPSHVAMTGGASSVSGVFVLDFGPPAPLPAPCGCVIQPDVARAATWLVVPIATDGAGEWSISFVIPTIPLLAGAQVVMQTALFGTASPCGFDLSNGVVATFGY